MVDFIFMLTRQDQAVADGLETFETVRSLGIQHVGCKVVGVSMDTRKTLNRAIMDSGATSYMEVVSETPNAGITSAQNAVEIAAASPRSLAPVPICWPIAPSRPTLWIWCRRGDAAWMAIWWSPGASSHRHGSGPGRRPGRTASQLAPRG